MPSPPARNSSADIQRAPSSSVSHGETGGGASALSAALGSGWALSTHRKNMSSFCATCVPSARRIATTPSKCARTPVSSNTSRAAAASTSSLSFARAHASGTGVTTHARRAGVACTGGRALPHLGETRHQLPATTGRWTTPLANDEHAVLAHDQRAHAHVRAGGGRERVDLALGQPARHHDKVCSRVGRKVAVGSRCLRVSTASSRVQARQVGNTSERKLDERELRNLVARVVSPQACARTHRAQRGGRRRRAQRRQARARRARGQCEAMHRAQPRASTRSG